MASELEKDFHQEMLEIYKRAKSEAGYNATRFLSMVTENSGPEAARTLLHATSVSDGYTALWERERLDPTVEAVVLKSRWRELFSDAEREIATTRLQQYGYKGPISAD
jgi:hypothetical protein